MKTNKTNKTIAMICIVLGVLVLASAVTRLVVGSAHSLVAKTAQWVSGSLPVQVPAIPDLTDMGHAVSDNSTQTIQLDQVKTISLNDPAGKIVVQTDPQARTATLQITKAVSANTISEDEARSQLKNIQIQQSLTGGVETIEAVFPAHIPNPGNGYRVDYTLTVPPTIALDAQVKAGEVTTSGLQSPVNVNVDAGKIQIVGYSDTVKATTKTGSIDIEGGQNIKNIEAQASIGEVSVSLPADANLKIDATTSLGAIHSALPVNGSTSLGKQSLHGQIGNGNDGQVTLSTQTGAININRE